MVGKKEKKGKDEKKEWGPLARARPAWHQVSLRPGIWAGKWRRKERLERQEKKKDDEEE